MWNQQCGSLKQQAILTAFCMKIYFHTMKPASKVTANQIQDFVTSTSEISTSKPATLNQSRIIRTSLFTFRFQTRIIMQPLKWQS